MSNSTVKTITTSELRGLRRAHTDMILVDVLSKEQFGKDHIEGAKNIPFGAADFLPGIARAASTKDKKIVVYCSGSSCKTSDNAAKALVAAGYTDVHAFEGGLADWRSSEKSATKGDEAHHAAGASGTASASSHDTAHGGKSKNSTPQVNTGGSFGAVHDPSTDKKKDQHKAGGR